MIPCVCQVNLGITLRGISGHEQVARADNFWNPDRWTLRRLVAAGADLDARDPAGQTAHIQAAAGGNAVSVEAGLALGADSDVTDAEGNTALDYARLGRDDPYSESSFAEVIAVLEAAEASGRSSQVNAG